MSEAYQPRIIDRELDELAGLPAIFIEGSRAVGKTATAARRVSEVLSLDDPVVAAAVAADPVGAIASAGRPLLLDEWQRVPAVWDAVRRAVDAGAASGSFLLTGSAWPPLGDRHSGAGRIVTVRMRPMGLAERLGLPTEISLERLLAGDRDSFHVVSKLTFGACMDALLCSGFPAIAGRPPREVRVQLEGYVENVLARDLEQTGLRVRSPQTLRRWLRAYAASTATNTTYEQIRAAATAEEADPPSRVTAIAHRDALERLWLLDPVDGWLPTGSELGRVTAAPKHHLADPALAAAMLGATKERLTRGTNPDSLSGSRVPFAAALFESLVVLTVRVLAQTVEARVAHLRTKEGRREVDLIVEARDGGIVAIEVKLGAAIDDHDVRHLRWLKTKLGDQLRDAVVITPDGHAYRRPDGIAVVPLPLLGL